MTHKVEDENRGGDETRQQQQHQSQLEDESFRIEEEEEESTSSSSSPILKLTLNNLRIISFLGRGAKGAVFRVRVPGSAVDLALKVVLKEKITSKEIRTDNDGIVVKYAAGAGHGVGFEQEVLSGLRRHPLLPRLRGVLVETESVVGYAIDYCSGGDLNSLRKRQSEKMFSDEIIRFYAAELVLILEHLHKSGIVYRDLKPENILIQQTGHLMLVDFDLSTKLTPTSPATATATHPPQKTQPDSRSKTKPIHHRLFFRRRSRRSNPGILPVDTDPSTKHKSRHRSSSRDPGPADGRSNSFVGTEDYMAPEIIAGNGHDFAVDWWGLGVVLHEMLYGTTPFRGSNRKETFYRVLVKTVSLVGETTALRDLIGRLLEKDPRRRIGVEGIKGHEFFKGVKWDLVLRIERPPFVPGVEEEEEGGVGMEMREGVDLEGIVRGMFNVESGGNVGDEVRRKECNENEVVWKSGLEHTRQCDNFCVF